MILNVSEILRNTSDRWRLAPKRTADATVQQRVLLVEDSELTRDMLEGVIRSLGYHVTEATDGRDALQCLEREVPDLIIADLEMPIMNGFELIKEVRGQSAYQDIPIVVLTSRGSDDDRQKAAALGADAYLIKADFKSMELAQVLGRFLSKG